MTEKNYKEMYESLKKLYDSQTHAVHSLEERERELIAGTKFLSEQLANCQEALDIAKNNLALALTDYNQRKESQAQEIIELRNKMRTTGEATSGH